MKVQLQPGLLRLRVDEAELAALLDGELVTLALTHAASVQWTFALSLDAAIEDIVLDAPAPARVAIRLPRERVQTYATTLPRRDALSFDPTGRGQGTDALTCIDFEVDVRDSIRTRGAGRSGA
jgi:hypothetical protein